MDKAIDRLNAVAKEREKMVYEILSGKKYREMSLYRYYKWEEKLNKMGYAELVKRYNKSRMMFELEKQSALSSLNKKGE